MVKKGLRDKHLKLRSNLKDKHVLDKKIEENILEFSKPYKIVSVFNSFGDEIHTHGIIEGLLAEGKIVACPRIINKVMQFVQVESLDDFKEGYFGIQEPKGSTIIDDKDFDLVIVPLLAFNTKLYRVGYGGGYYDNFLRDIHAFKLGIAYEWKRVDHNFQQEYDVKLDAIMTEEGLKYD